MTSTPPNPNGQSLSTIPKSPDKLTPKSELPPPVDLEHDDDPIPTDAEAARILREEMGLIEVGTSHVFGLQKLGVYLKGNGVVKNQRGVAFVAQHRLSSAMEILHAELMEGRNRPKRRKGQPREETKLNIEDMCRIAHELGFVAGKLTESQEVMLRMSGSNQTSPDLPPAEAPTRHSFPVGSTVVYAENFQVNQSVEKSTSEQKAIAKKL